MSDHEGLVPGDVHHEGVSGQAGESTRHAAASHQSGAGPAARPHAEPLLNLFLLDINVLIAVVDADHRHNAGN